MRAVGIILAGGNSRKMRELTHKRAVAAMPVAGSYRSIDFALSNMSNSVFFSCDLSLLKFILAIPKFSLQKLLQLLSVYKVTIRTVKSILLSPVTAKLQRFHRDLAFHIPILDLGTAVRYCALLP